MTRSIELPETTFTQLELMVRRRGYTTLVEYLSKWAEMEANRPRATLAEIDQLRDEMLAKYGSFSDSTQMIREDRDR